jgi:hypothetical protein
MFLKSPDVSEASGDLRGTPDVSEVPLVFLRSPVVNIFKQ